MAARIADREAAALALLEGARRRFAGRLALVSSFGAESAVLLDLVARTDPGLPVIFLDTGKLFPETLAYREQLARRLGLRDVRDIRPDPARLDPDPALWQRDPDLCCWQRKVEPLDAALEGFEAWITGRKRFQGALRETLPEEEAGPDGRVKINPLAGWDRDDLQAYFAARDLPRHPLEAAGYRSIGCLTCTRPVVAGEAARAGRWTGMARTECGIHLPRPAAARS